MVKKLISYAQNREDLILYVLLHNIKTGFYVDVGANDPVIDSVTKFFYDKGWRGINIEPIRPLYKKLVTNRARDINLNIGISNEPGKLVLQEYQNGKHGWSTFSPEIKSKRNPAAHKDYEVEVRTLGQVFAQAMVKTIDFLKIDVEGFEYEVLSGNDWGKYRPKVIVVEDTSPEKWLNLLINAGYKEVYWDGLNRYLVRIDLIDVHKMNDYESVLLSGATVLTARHEAALKQLVATQAWLRETQNELSKLRDEKNQLDILWAHVASDPGSVLSTKELLNAVIKKRWHKLPRNNDARHN